MHFNGCRPLFASSLLGIVRILLEQTRHDEMRILGCNTLVDFINSQVITNNLGSVRYIMPIAWLHTWYI